jgi:CTP:molybdopterin cytidylyltransferase MocA
MSMITVVLAAGASSRMGSPKALLDLDGVSYLGHITATARSAGTENVSVVLGPPDGDKIKSKLPNGAGFVWNPDPSRGMLSSVQSAVQNLPSRATGILVWPVDLPQVSVASVRAILAGAPGKVIIPRYNGKGGHPVRIPRALFGAIASMPSDAGLHGLFETHAASVSYLDLDDAHLISDIDTPADAAKAAAKKR